MTPTFSPAARQDLLAAAQWYLAEGGMSVAERFEQDVQRALRLLAAMPRMGRAQRDGIRTWPLKRFPFLVVYRVHGDVLTVVALAHQSRDPGWWHGR